MSSAKWTCRRSGLCRSRGGETARATDGAGSGEAPSGRINNARGFSRGLNNHPPLDGVATETVLPGLETEVGVPMFFAVLTGDSAVALPLGFGSRFKPPRLVSHGDRGVRDRTGNAVAAAPAVGLCILPSKDLFAGDGSAVANWNVGGCKGEPYGVIATAG